MVIKMNSLRYITDEKGKPIEVILPLKDYQELIEFKNTYEEKLNILTSIKNGAEEILRDRVDNHLNQDLTEFINELEDHPH